MRSVINKQFIKAAKDNQLDELKNLLSQGADIHINNSEALRDSARIEHIEVFQVLSAFVQEEKLLVAVSDAIIVQPSVSTWVSSMPQTQVLALVNSDACHYW